MGHFVFPLSHRYQETINIRERENERTNDKNKALMDISKNCFIRQHLFALNIIHNKPKINDRFTPFTRLTR